jgi:hypothetical protein
MGLPARLAPGAATYGFVYDMDGYSRVYREKHYELDLEKYSARPITLSHDGILTNNVLLLNRGTLEMRIAVSHE